MLASDLELAAVIETRRRAAAGYSATAHNKAFLTERKPKSLLRHGPLRIPTHPLQPPRCEVPGRLHRRGHVPRAGRVQEVVKRRRLRKRAQKGMSSFVARAKKSRPRSRVTNLVPLRPFGVFSVELIESQVEHAVVAPIQRRLFKVLHRLFVVLQYNPMVPAQTIQGAN